MNVAIISNGHFVLAGWTEILMAVGLAVRHTCLSYILQVQGIKLAEARCAAASICPEAQMRINQLYGQWDARPGVGWWRLLVTRFSTMELPGTHRSEEPLHISRRVGTCLRQPSYSAVSWRPLTVFRRAFISQRAHPVVEMRKSHLVKPKPGSRKRSCSHALGVRVGGFR